VPENKQMFVFYDNKSKQNKADLLDLTMQGMALSDTLSLFWFPFSTCLHRR